MLRVVSVRYRAPNFSSSVVQFITLVFVTLTIFRGVGMLPHGAFYGASLVVGGVGYWAAWLSRRHFFVWAAHAVLICAYFSLGWHSLGLVLDGAGYDRLVTPVGGMIWHSLLSYQMKPLPRPQDPRSSCLEEKS